MKHLKFFAALCCAAAVLAACDKTDEPANGGQNDNPNNPPVENPDTVPAENPDTLVTAEYTLTVLSADTTLGTVTGSGKYAAGTAVKVVATPKRGFELASWSDTDAADTEREITLVSDSTITASFGVASPGTANGHEYVDLGLSVKWATMNVGANVPPAYGDYFAWGETATKKTYSWDTYKYCDPASTCTGEAGQSLPCLTKYCTNVNYGKDNFIDLKATLEAEDDAASVNWGGAWRMPTADEWTELRDNCDWTWTDNYNGTGVAGRIVTSKANGNSIFLPAAGYRDGGSLYRAGDGGYYWSGSLYTGSPSGAWYVGFYSGYVYRSGNIRYCGLSVRPVLP